MGDGLWLLSTGRGASWGMRNRGVLAGSPQSSSVRPYLADGETEAGAESSVKDPVPPHLRAQPPPEAVGAGYQDLGSSPDASAQGTGTFSKSLALGAFSLL